MPASLFISFANDDIEAVRELRALAKNPNNKLEFHDRSELEPVKDRVGKPLPYPPNDHRGDPIREKLKELFDEASRMLVIVGETTSKRQWVNWEIRVFWDNKKGHGGPPKSRIRAMKCRGCHNADLPKALLDLSVPAMNWDVDALITWLEK